MRLLIAATLLGCSFSCSSRAAVARDEDKITVRSISGQFVINSPKTIPKLPAPDSNAPTNLIKTIELEPNLLVVICERIKQNILFTLNLKDEWKGSIIINIYPARSYNDSIWVNACHTDRGWVYYLDIPSQIEMNRLIRSLVEVLLQELADRKAGSKPSELPPWLAPAFSLNVHLTAPDITILEPFSKKVRVDRRTNPINLIKKRLLSEQPLTWDELTWPDDETIQDFSFTNRYTICSYLFVHQLLKFPDGIAKMNDFFSILPARWNWQVAFIEAFKPHFYSMRDVEKWWSVTLAAFSGRTELKTLTFEESLKKLDDIVDSPVKIPIQTNENNTNQTQAVIKRLPLQQIIAQFSYSQHRQLLRQKAVELAVLRQQAHPALKRLVEDYKTTLEHYLSRRYRSGYESELPPFMPDSPRLIARDTLNRLDALDLIRSDLKQYGLNGVYEDEPVFNFDRAFMESLSQTQQAVTNLPPAGEKKPAPKNSFSK